MSYTLITRPLSMGELLDVAFRIYRKHFWKLVLTAGALLIPWQIINDLLAARTMSNLMSMIAAGPEAGPPSMTPVMSSSIQGLVSLISLVAVIVSVMAATWLADRLLHGEEPGIVASWRAGLKYFFPYLIMILLIGVVGFFLFLFIIILALIPCLGILLLLGAGAGVFYLSVRIMLSPMALVVDDLGPVAAIRQAFWLSRRDFWRIAGYSLLVWILIFALNVVPMLFVKGAAMGVAVQEPNNFMTGAAIASIISTLLNALWLPLALLALVALYHDLKLRHPGQGADIEKRIDALASSMQTSLPEPESQPNAATSSSTPFLPPEE